MARRPSACAAPEGAGAYGPARPALSGRGTERATAILHTRSSVRTYIYVRTYVRLRTSMYVRTYVSRTGQVAAARVLVIVLRSLTPPLSSALRVCLVIASDRARARARE
jgi:hypothetical protein